MSEHLTAEQLDQIEQAAKKATQGPWKVIPATIEDGRRIAAPAYELMGVDIDAPYLDPTDAEYIATMDPTTTLQFVAEVKELRLALRAEALRHKQSSLVCGKCRRHGVCHECLHSYPCPSVRALGGES